MFEVGDRVRVKIPGLPYNLLGEVKSVNPLRIEVDNPRGAGTVVIEISPEQVEKR